MRRTIIEVAVRVLALLLLPLLASCAQVGQKIGPALSADAKVAAIIDPSAAPCYQALGALGDALAQDTGSGPRLLTTIAVTRSLQNTVQAGPCAPITAAVLVDLIRLGLLAPASAPLLIGLP